MLLFVASLSTPLPAHWRKSNYEKVIYGYQHNAFCSMRIYIAGDTEDIPETPEFKKYVAEIEAYGQMKLERFEF